MGEKNCPWCAERIQAEAIKCRYCGSRLGVAGRDPRDWHRGYAERRVAGVCSAVAHNLGVSVTAVRAAFLLLALLHGVGIALYLVLWFLLPDVPSGRSGLDRAADAWRTLLGRPPEASGAPGNAAPNPSHAPPEGTGRTGDQGGEGTSGGWSPTRS